MTPKTVLLKNMLGAIFLYKGKLTVNARHAKLMAEQKARHGAKRTVSTR
jgi:hypothetical protein